MVHPDFYTMILTPFICGFVASSFTLQRRYCFISTFFFFYKTSYNSVIFQTLECALNVQNASRLISCYWLNIWALTMNAVGPEFDKPWCQQLMLFEKSTFLISNWVLFKQMNVQCSFHIWKWPLLQSKNPGDYWKLRKSRRPCHVFGLVVLKECQTGWIVAALSHTADRSCDSAVNKTQNNSFVSIW